MWDQCIITGQQYRPHCTQTRKVLLHLEYTDTPEARWRISVYQPDRTDETRL